MEACEGPNTAQQRTKDDACDDDMLLLYVRAALIYQAVADTQFYIHISDIMKNIGIPPPVTQKTIRKVIELTKPPNGICYFKLDKLLYTADDQKYMSKSSSSSQLLLLSNSSTSSNNRTHDNYNKTLYYRAAIIWKSTLTTKWNISVPTILRQLSGISKEQALHKKMKVSRLAKLIDVSKIVPDDNGTTNSIHLAIPFLVNKKANKINNSATRLAQAIDTNSLMKRYVHNNSNSNGIDKSKLNVVVTTPLSSSSSSSSLCPTFRKLISPLNSSITTGRNSMNGVNDENVAGVNPNQQKGETDTIATTKVTAAATGRGRSGGGSINLPPCQYPSSFPPPPRPPSLTSSSGVTFHPPSTLQDNSRMHAMTYCNPTQGQPYHHQQQQQQQQHSSSYHHYHHHYHHQQQQYHDHHHNPNHPCRHHGQTLIPAPSMYNNHDHHHHVNSHHYYNPHHHPDN